MSNFRVVVGSSEGTQYSRVENVVGFGCTLMDVFKSFVITDEMKEDLSQEECEELFNHLQTTTSVVDNHLIHVDEEGGVIMIYQSA